MRYEVEMVDLQEQPTAVVRGRVPRDGIAAFVGHAFGAVMAAVAQQGRQVAGAPYARYLRMDDEGWDVEAGFPVRQAVAPAGEVQPSTLPGGRTARTLHVGDYAALGGAYDALKGWVVDNGYVPDGEPWECYLDEPGVPEPRTEVFMPCADSRRP